MFREVREAGGRFIYKAQYRGAGPRVRLRGGLEGRGPGDRALPGRLGSGPPGRTCPRRDQEPEARGRRAGGPGGVPDARYSPSAVAIILGGLGAAAETRDSGKEEGSERLTGRGREAPSRDTPPAARRHPARRSVAELRRKPGCRCPPSLVGTRGVSALREASRRAGAATPTAPLPPSPRPLLARRRRGSRRGEKWRAMAVPPRSTGLADGAPFSAARAGQRLECTK